MWNQTEHPIWMWAPREGRQREANSSPPARYLQGGTIKTSPYYLPNWQEPSIPLSLSL